MITDRIVKSENTNPDAIKRIKQNPMGKQKMESGMLGRKQQNLHQQRRFKLTLETHEILTAENRVRRGTVTEHKI